MSFERERFEHGLAQMRTVADCVRLAASVLSRADLCFAHGTDDALDEAHLLVLDVLDLARFAPRREPLPSELYHARVTSEERARIGELVARRIEERVPAAYLTRRAWFAGLELYVDERVLIPRSPLAELAEGGFEPWLDAGRVRRVLDVGTGSGCIAIACAYAFPAAEVVAADVDEGARAVAGLNVERHGLEARVAVVASDVLAGVEGTFDLIVSNPPYVPPAEVDALPAEFHHEPRRALEGGEDGLDVVRRLLREAPSRLSPHGALVVEVGASRPALEAAYPSLGFVWLDDALERGGEGVFLLARADLGGGGR